MELLPAQVSELVNYAIADLCPNYEFALPDIRALVVYWCFIY